MPMLQDHTLFVLWNNNTAFFNWCLGKRIQDPRVLLYYGYQYIWETNNDVRHFTLVVCSFIAEKDE